MDQLQIGGEFWYEIRDVDGTLLRRGRFHNGTTTSGLTNMLNTYFAGATPSTTWCVGVIDNSGFSALATGDTMSSHSGWAESTAYSEGARPTMAFVTAAAPSITGPNVTFTASGSVTLAGAFLVSNSTKGGSTGQLWASGQFGSPQSLTIGQTITVGYACASAGN